MPEALQRILTMKHEDAIVEVPVLVHWPEPQGESWVCHWEIGWPDETQKRCAGGSDAVQALQCALEMIGANLYYSEAHEAGALSWGEGWVGYGFPVSATIRDMLIGDDLKYL